MSQTDNKPVESKGKTDESVSVDKKIIIQTLQTLEGLKRRLHSWLKEA